MRIVVTRPEARAGELVRRLESLGHEVVLCPLIETVPLGDEPIDLAGYDWVVVTSRTGAALLAERARGGWPRIAAIGPGTAEALRERGLEPALIPAVSTQEGLTAEFPRPPGRVLFAGAEGARRHLVEELGADFLSLYRTVELAPADSPKGDFVVLASASAAAAFARLDAQIPAVSIGPETTRAGREAGLHVVVEAHTNDLEGLVEAVRDACFDRFRPPHEAARFEEVDSTPLVESLADGHSLVTLVSRDAGASRVRVFGGLEGASADHDLRRIPGTDVWRRSFRLPDDTRTLYWLCRDDDEEPGHADPLNPRRYTIRLAGSALASSLLELPKAPLLPAIGQAAVEEHVFRSAILGNERRLWTTTTQDDPEALLVLLDGSAYAHELGVPQALEHLSAEGRIPRTVAVMPESLPDTRSRELACNPAHARHLAEELVPWARERFGVGGPVTVGGLSFSGLAALFAAESRSDVFGVVVSQSGAFHWSGGWLTDRLRGRDLRGLRVWLGAGNLEGGDDFRIIPDEFSLLEANRRLRPVLEEAGAEVRYVEFSGGHDHPCFAALLPDALEWALASA